MKLTEGNGLASDTSVLWHKVICWVFHFERRHAVYVRMEYLSLGLNSEEHMIWYKKTGVMWFSNENSKEIYVKWYMTLDFGKRIKDMKIWGLSRVTKFVVLK